MKSKVDYSQVLASLFEVRDQIHYWHFQTKSYAEHKALDKFYNGLLDLTDELTEVHQGKYGARVKGTQVLTITDYSDNCAIPYLESFKTFLMKGARACFAPEDTELNNIMDEILALTDKTLYLLTLK